MNNKPSTLLLADEEATLSAGALIGKSLLSNFRPGLITLKGDLGAGKTTFCRGLLRGMGHTGSVKSPTFTLVEPYEVNGLHIAHFDLYRLEDPEELDFMGFRDYLSGDTLCLVEWPEKGGSLLAHPDLEITLIHSGRQRQLSCQALTKTGELLASALPSTLFSSLSSDS